MKKLSVKAILSTLLILVFLCLVFTGALLYFGRTGLVLGISRHMLRETHFWVAASTCLLIPVHLMLNLRIFRAELRALKRKFGIRNSEFGIEKPEDQESEDRDME